jgi:hypothetical protein
LQKRKHYQISNHHETVSDSLNSVYAYLLLAKRKISHGNVSPVSE